MNEMEATKQNYIADLKSFLTIVKKGKCNADDIEWYAKQFEISNKNLEKALEDTDGLLKAHKKFLENKAADRVSKVRSNYEEKLAAFEGKKMILPYEVNYVDFMKQGLNLIMRDQHLFVGKKVHFTIKNYFLAGDTMAKEIPKDMQAEITGWIFARLGPKHEVYGFELYNEFLEPIESFHTNPNICLGNLDLSTRDLNSKNPAEMSKAIDRVAVLLETVNTSDMLHPGERYGKLFFDYISNEAEEARENQEESPLYDDEEEPLSERDQE